MSAVSGGSGGQSPYNCGGDNNSSRSPDLSPKEEEVVQKIRKEAEKALEGALGCCSVCGCPGGSCPLNKPVKNITPKDEQAWRKVLATATDKLRRLANGDNGNNGNPNAYDWYPEDPSSNSHNHEEKNSGNPNAYNG